MPQDRVFSGHQPNFLPYMGFFYKMYRSDIFVLDDDVQYSRDGLHNANFIKVNGEKHRITVPVSYEHGDPINKVRICYDKPWISKILKTLQMSYGRAMYFEGAYDLIECRLNQRFEYLVNLNITLIRDIAREMGLKTEIILASEYVPTELKKNERNVFQCLAMGGNVYYSGEGGRAYNDIAMFERNGISVVYSDYEPLHYHQVGNGFIENLSVLDYIFNRGFTLPEEWRDHNAEE